MKKDDIFDEISSYCNYIDRETIKSVYYGLVRAISRRLRVDGRSEMPDWGKFYLHRHKPRVALNINSRNFESLGAKTTVKFDPDHKVKQYFYEIKPK
jgi:nucleoid DNA-binding protein